VLQLGDRVIFTDPFLTHQSLARVWLGGTLKADSQKAIDVVGCVPVPNAIFIGHSHYDHLLDAPGFLQQPAWKDVPVYGSTSTRNLLCGSSPELTNRWHNVLTNTVWQQVSPGIRYKAFPAIHGRQVPLLPLLYSGNVEDCRWPERGSNFKVGDCYAFVFELSNERVTNTIYFVGAAHADGQGVPDPSVKAVDLAILCVPTWKLSKGYPTNLIQCLKPAHILASHFDDFFQVNAGEPEVVALADMEGFLQKVQRSANYPEFQDMVVPSVGSVCHFRTRASP